MHNQVADRKETQFPFYYTCASYCIPRSDSAPEAPLYLVSDHQTTNPKRSLLSAAQQNTQTQSNRAFSAYRFCNTVTRFFFC